MNNQAVISVAVAPVYKEPIFTSEMVTQVLLWESVEILKDSERWFFISMEDGYKGWIHSFYLEFSFPLVSNYSTITQRLMSVYHTMNQIESICTFLSFGTSIPIESTSENYDKVYLPSGKMVFLQLQKESINKNRETIVRLAKSLIGVPYLWGGRSAFGFDCSGFVQMIMKVIDINFHRDSNQQIHTNQLELN